MALRFKTNSWGGKYDLPDDATVGDDIARLAATPVRRFDFVLEGGAVDHDGEGTILTTRQTLLNPNRNGWTKAAAEQALGRCFRRQESHLDRRRPEERSHRRPYRQHCALRRAGPRRLPGAGRPGRSKRGNAGRHCATLEAATDASGRKLEVVRIPGVGLYRNALGEVAPASHMNFIIANGVVVVPVYGTADAGDGARSAADGLPDPQSRWRIVSRFARQRQRRRRLVSLHHSAGAGSRCRSAR